MTDRADQTDALTSWHGQVSVKDRLDAAMRFALTDSIFGVPEDAFQRVRMDILQTTTPKFAEVHGSENAETYPGYCELVELTDRTIQTSAGPDLNMIWSDPSFVLPAITATAQMFERLITPHGDSRLTIYLRKEPESLYGYRLEDVRARAFERDSAGRIVIRNLDKQDYLAITTFFVGAAYFFLRGSHGARIGCRYLLKEAGSHFHPADAGLDIVPSRYILPM
jgi:hypothetical protein